jgi:hypothetical protein
MIHPDEIAICGGQSQEAIMAEQVDDKFGPVISALSGEPGVTVGEGMFNATGVLKVNSKIFSMMTGGRLVVKLPKARVNALVDAGEGVRFDPGHGRVMKEWLSLDPASSVDWLSLSKEALSFVGSKTK